MLTHVGGDYGDPLHLTTFEMPDLEYVDFVDLDPMPELEEWSVPKLERANIISFEVPAFLPTLEFPALKHAQRVNINGNFSTVSFPALGTLEQRLLVSNRNETGLSGETSLNISAPQLTNASGMGLSGKISRISFPKLEIINKEVDGFSTGLSVSHLGDELLEIEFPALSAVVGDAYFSGNLSSISVPLLRNITGKFSVDSEDPISINLPVENADVIFLLGFIEEVGLPNLRNWSEITISSDSRLDCDEFVGGLNRTFPDGLPGEVSCDSLKTLEDRFGSQDGTDAAGMVFAKGLGVLLAFGLGVIGLGGMLF
ncbi:hypothetical protein ASPSYDRAFT_40211 [Aspergillus sydowii CBS 593.65]|uniref:Receptor L-domain domain-containing protein n=1 Tax=Aspergillus sydowii CBS 593.65 TaxID=1036612 RepID=A0A1L9U169_9EURO|nr:uncharacterized protein ASPSYDRAFT_40211 [Aspergillus sydowii CBS 593.65]OJJ65405.1 hypothetical protein ASPSYDRAFT_40211 [Aspergillus sydowii CBS 593.65]